MVISTLLRNALAVVLLASAAPAPSPLGAPDADLTSGGFTLAGKSLALPATLTSLESAIGKPSRTVGEAWQPNRLLVWDDLGLVAYQSNQTKMVNVVAIYLARVPDRDFSPKHLFSAKLRVATQSVTPSSTLDQVGKILLADGATHISRLAFGVWNLAYGRVHVSLEQIDSPTLQTVSVAAPQS